MLLSLLAAAAASTSPSPVPGEIYEGPALKGTSWPIRFEIANGGRRVERLSFGFERGCRTAADSSFDLNNLPVRKRRFGFRYDKYEAYERARHRISLTGRFSPSGDAMTATFRWRVQRGRKGKMLCDTGAVRLRATVPERALVNGGWAGATVQQRPVRFTITREGVTAATAQVLLTCEDGQQIERALGPFNAPTQLWRPDATFNLRSQEGSTVVGLYGKARRDLITGVVTASDWLPGPGGTSLRCSGEAAFEARRP